MPDEEPIGFDRLENNDRPMAGQADPPYRSTATESAWIGYEIKIKDHMDTYWYEWFDGWSITNLDNGEVLLSSSRVDQSGLHGALNKIRDLNLTVLSVTRRSSET